MPKRNCYYCKGTGKEDGDYCMMCRGRGFDVETDEDEPLICPHCGGDNYVPKYCDPPQEDGSYDKVDCECCGKTFDVTVEISREYTFKTHKPEEES